MRGLCLSGGIRPDFPAEAGGPGRRTILRSAPGLRGGDATTPSPTLPWAVRVARADRALPEPGSSLIPSVEYSTGIARMSWLVAPPITSSPKLHTALCEVDSIPDGQAREHHSLWLAKA